MAAVGLLSAGAFAQTPPTAADLPELPVDEVFRGQTGYGLSVFAGSEPERFGVEVVGVLREMDPGTSFIVARLSGQGLEQSGVVAGMSGSPVYLDDRLVGAVAYSWAFTAEPLALITPIAAMRELSLLEPGENAAGSLGLATAPGTTMTFAEALRSLFEPPADPAPRVSELVAQQLGSLVGGSTWGGRGGASIAAFGFGESVRRMLAAVPAGNAAADTDLPPLDAGSAVAGVLVDGDLKLAVGGTVTRVNGGEVLAMGHPFLGVGPLLVPMATVEVVGVVPRLDSSTRLSNVGDVVGAFDQDRFAGLRGRLGAEARTIPMSIRVEAADGGVRSYDLRLADLPRMLPSLVAIPAMQALETASYGGGESGLEMTGTLKLRGHEEIPLRQTFDGSGPAISAAFYLLVLVGALVNSDDEAVGVESVDLVLRQTHAPRLIEIERAQVSSKKVRSGDVIDLVFHLKRHRGERFRETLEVTIPADRRPGRYYLFVGDGESIDGARLQLVPGSPSSLEDELDLLRSFQPKSRLVALGVAPARGLIVEGRPMPELPASVRSIWQASPLQGEPRALNLAIVREDGRDIGTPVDGLFRLDLEILPGPAP